MALATIEGGAGEPAEPDWNTLFDDELDQAFASESWSGLIREMREAGTLVAANGHQIKRLVLHYVFYDLACRHCIEQQPVVKAKKTAVPQYNAWWTILTNADVRATALEAELGISPRRRAGASKVQRQKRVARPADAYLKPVRA